MARAVATAVLVLVACAALALTTGPSGVSDSRSTQLALGVEQWAAVPPQQQAEYVEYNAAPKQMYAPQRVAQQQLQLFSQQPPADGPVAPQQAASTAPAGAPITDAPAVPERNLPSPAAAHPQPRDWSKIGNGDVSAKAGGNGFGSGYVLFLSFALNARLGLRL
jgi:hypothetical protein